MNTYPQHIIEYANRMIAKGSVMTFDAICQMKIKSEAKAAKKSGSNKQAAKWEQRANVENNTSTRDIAEINRENAIRNLPSSMR